MLPKARTEGEDYSDDDSSNDDSDDESMDSDEQSNSEDDSDNGPKVGVAGKKSTKMNKTIQKKKEGKGRFKSNGNRKTKGWILKKKDRQKRQGNATKTDSKYSGRKRPGSWN